MALKSILHGQITQKIVFEVRPKNAFKKSFLIPSEKIQNHFFEILFLTHFENGIKKLSTWADY